MSKRDKMPGLSETDCTPDEHDKFRQGGVPGDTLKAKAVFGSGQVTSKKWVRKGSSEEGRVSRVSREKKKVTLSKFESRYAKAEGTARAGVLQGECWCQSAQRIVNREINRRGNNRLYYEKGNFKRLFGNSAYIKHFGTICKCRNYPSMRRICAKVKVCLDFCEFPRWWQLSRSSVCDGCRSVQCRPVSTSQIPVEDKAILSNQSSSPK
ncbi:hypothetical protein MJG53_012122 [Ovis ammon polii x Ovis aries]|uniref:Uncharacterized protein n=1 Tax=Ovis ammon polii x Ovis aries TaxID=2918886 RepID=A0ACB9UR94_9CETA|nr:hypothetical protein MJG53_012122 [Ovis ammon polii x Ovis aries]